jgi:hypothetical protein
MSGQKVRLQQASARQKAALKRARARPADVFTEAMRLATANVIVPLPRLGKRKRPVELASIAEKDEDDEEGDYTAEEKAAAQEFESKYIKPRPEFSPLEPARAVCIKVSELRRRSPKALQNVMEWLADPNHVYAGRTWRITYKDEKGNDKRVTIEGSKWRNKFSGTRRLKSGRKIPKHACALKLYRESLYKKAKDGTRLIDQIGELRGKEIGCWCEPGQTCHAQLLVDELAKADAAAATTATTSHGGNGQHACSGVYPLTNVGLSTHAQWPRFAPTTFALSRPGALNPAPQHRHPSHEHKMARFMTFPAARLRILPPHIQSSYFG